MFWHIPDVLQGSDNRIWSFSAQQQQLEVNCNPPIWSIEESKDEPGLRSDTGRLRSGRKREMNNDGMITTGERGSHKWVIAVQWVRRRGLQGHGRLIAGTGRKATGVRDRDWGGGGRAGGRWRLAGVESKGPERESVYRRWCINSRAVSKSARSAESLWIGAQKIHWPTVSHLWCRKDRLVVKHEVIFCSPSRDKAGITLRPLRFSLKKIRLHVRHEGVKCFIFFFFKDQKWWRRRERSRGTSAKVTPQTWCSLQTELRRVDAQPHAKANTHTHKQFGSCAVCVTYQAKHVSPLDMKKKQTVTWWDGGRGRVPELDVVQSESKLSSDQ